MRTVLRTLGIASVAALVGCVSIPDIDLVQDVDIIPKVNGHSVDSPMAASSVAASDDPVLGLDVRYPFGRSVERSQIRKGFCFRNGAGDCVFQANDGGFELGHLMVLALGGGLVYWLLKDEEEENCSIPSGQRRGVTSPENRRRYEREGCTCETTSTVHFYYCYG